jgi:hypothetical protein
MTASLTCKPKAPASEVTAVIARRTIPASMKYMLTYARTSADPVVAAVPIAERHTRTSLVKAWAPEVVSVRPAR